MEFLFDSRNAEFKVPYGCVEQGQTMRLTVYCDEDEAEIFLLLRPDGSEEDWITMTLSGHRESYCVFSAECDFSSAGLYFYRFCVQKKSGESVYFGCGEFHRPEQNEQKPWQVLCYDAEVLPPQSFCGAVYYQIFPDRFFKAGECDLSEKLQPFWVHSCLDDVPQYQPDENGEIKNNDFFGGNLRGITEKMEYISSLGAEVIYLNPIFMAFSNHRYDTADYRRVDPMLGTEEDFKELCAQAHKKGIRVILDGVFSHTGDNSAYFDQYHHFGNGAVSNPNSPYRSWYRFSHYPTEYESWWGIRTLPCVEEMNPSFLEYIVTGRDSVIRHWLRLGADGYRLDVADELPDSFLQAVYRTVKEEKPDAVVIGEVWEDASNKISYGVRRRYFCGGELDGVMNYVYRSAIIDFVSGVISAENFMEQVLSIAENYPQRVLDCTLNLLSSHDTGRIFTLLAGEDGNRMSRDARASARLSEEEYRRGLPMLGAAVFLLFTLPGSPCIYYGDENGMQGYEDPFNRRFFDWEREDKIISGYYRAMAAARKKSEALRTGRIFPCAAQNGFVAFYRETDTERALCMLNLTKYPICIPLEKKKELVQFRTKIGNGSVTLLPYGCGVFL